MTPSKPVPKRGKRPTLNLEALGGDLNPRPRAAATSLAAAKLGSFPPPLDLLYAQADGGRIGAVDLFTLDELLDVNTKQPNLRKGFPSAFFFASDGADGFFCVDVANDRGGGKGAVLWVERSSGRATPCARTLLAFLSAPSAPPPAVEESSADWDAYQDGFGEALAAVGAHAVALSPALRRDELKRLPSYEGFTAALSALLGLGDGLRFPSGTRAFPARDLRPATELAWRFAFWFAEGPDGASYAIGTSRDDVEWVLRREGSGVVVVGRLDLVLLSWSRADPVR